MRLNEFKAVAKKELNKERKYFKTKQLNEEINNENYQKNKRINNLQIDAIMDTQDDKKKRR